MINDHELQMWEDALLDTTGVPNHKAMEPVMLALIREVRALRFEVRQLKQDKFKLIRDSEAY